MAFFIRRPHPPSRQQSYFAKTCNSASQLSFDRGWRRAAAVCRQLPASLELSQRNKIPTQGGNHM
eukprot:836070-Rhodomonas_salina.1